MEKDEKIEQLLINAYSNVKIGSFKSANDSLEQALSLDFDNTEIVSSMKCISFWKDRHETLSGIKSAYEKGEYILGQWKIFITFLNRAGNATERCLYALRQLTFQEALGYYKEVLEESGNLDPEILLRIGKCLKRLGDYEQALKHLETASRQRKEDPEILSELADCYAMINEERAAKAFFREAFFLNSGQIDLGSLESGMIRRLIEKVRSLGHEPPVLEEWIPVYGTLYGIFTVKRELRALEYGKLKQAIFNLENDIKDQKGDSALLIPRLINRYFWLIDHYVSSREDHVKVDDVLRKIQKLDPSVYNQYTN